ncbi:DUF6197 family protein [Streptomyces chartreusis]|uniref:DUF6197 family protein n=1 Tax=Streptomyces chartreusis TaxID=1969 RepID=UPI00123D8371|nr:hypothetical protein [Streptomyces chartreusis]QEV66278.1 hypothetical protein CP983_06080 [Streptomyces chartreusis]GGW99198.1 hypothetical protein GCM10010321_12120 [Streptomyces chartreusis]
MKLSETYLKAADVIRTNGHYKGSYYGVGESGVGIQLTPAESPVCAVGALSIAVDGQPVPCSDEVDVIALDFAQHLRLPMPDSWPTIAISEWNDEFDRTPGDVIAAFEQAARKVA